MPTKRRPGALDLVLDQPWAILPESLETIRSIAFRENESPEAVAAKLGRRLENTRRVEMRDGVAIIPVVGPISPRANLFTEVSGATSIETLATDFRTAVEDPDVGSIVLDIDSPGGRVTGVSEFAAQIYAARSEKPVIAYIGGTGASAAYWLASAASQVIVESTGLAGSIGAVLALRSTRARDEKTGVKNIEIVSAQSPRKRMDPETPEGRDSLQALVDDLATVFIADVARYRGVSEDTVLNDFGQGGLLVGEKAVQTGLADAVGDLEGLIGRLQAQEQGSLDIMAREKAVEPTPEEQIIDSVAALEAAYPQLVALIRKESAGESAIIERRRILGIQENMMENCGDIIEAAIEDGETTPDMVAVQIIKRVREQGERVLAQIESQTPEPVPASHDAGDASSDDDAVQNAIAGANKRTNQRPTQSF